MGHLDFVPLWNVIPHIGCFPGLALLTGLWVDTGNRYREVVVFCSEFLSQCIRHSKTPFVVWRWMFCFPGISRVGLVYDVLCHILELLTWISDFVSKGSFLDLFTFWLHLAFTLSTSFLILRSDNLPLLSHCMWGRDQLAKSPLPTSLSSFSTSLSSPVKWKLQCFPDFWR